MHAVKSLGFTSLLHTHTFLRYVTHSLTHSLTHSPTHSLTRSLTRHCLTLVGVGPKPCGTDRYGDQYPYIGTQVIRDANISISCTSMYLHNCVMFLYTQGNEHQLAKFFERYTKQTHDFQCTISNARFPIYGCVLGLPL